jgi:hypothetical protein
MKALYDGGYFVGERVRQGGQVGGVVVAKYRGVCDETNFIIGENSACEMSLNQ